jgi:hypothetical protein
MLSTIVAASLFGAAVAAPAPTSGAGGKVQVYIMMGQSNMLGEGKIGTQVTLFRGHARMRILSHTPVKRHWFELDCCPRNSRPTLGVGSS